MKRIGLILGIILVAGAIGASGFWGGMTYQKNQADQIQQAFINDRGQPNGEQFPAGGQIPPGGQLPGGGQRMGMGPGGGAAGEVKSVDGNMLTLSTAQDVQTVTLTDATEVQKTDIVGIDELEPGMRVIITGESDEEGNLTASIIMIMNDDVPTRFNRAAPGAAATQTAP